MNFLRDWARMFVLLAMLTVCFVLIPVACVADFLSNLFDRLSQEDER